MINILTNALSKAKITPKSAEPKNITQNCQAELPRI